MMNGDGMDNRINELLEAMQTAIATKQVGGLGVGIFEVAVELICLVYTK